MLNWFPVFGVSTDLFRPCILYLKQRNIWYCIFYNSYVVCFQEASGEGLQVAHSKCRQLFAKLFWQ